MEDNNFTNQFSQPQQPVNQAFNNQFQQIPIPNSSAVLTLGILSIVLCACAGIVGLILGIIALVLANKAHALYNINPNSFTTSSLNNLKAGKICAIIGTVLSALYFVYYIVIICIVGAAMTSLPWNMMNGH